MGKRPPNTSPLITNSLPLPQYQKREQAGPTVKLLKKKEKEKSYAKTNPPRTNALCLDFI